MWIVSALYELKHRPPSLFNRVEHLPVKQLALQGGKEALAHGIAEAVGPSGGGASARHGQSPPGLPPSGVSVASFLFPGIFPPVPKGCGAGSTPMMEQLHQCALRAPLAENGWTMIGEKTQTHLADNDWLTLGEKAWTSIARRMTTIRLMDYLTIGLTKYLTTRPPPHTPPRICA